MAIVCCVRDDEELSEFCGIFGKQLSELLPKVLLQPARDNHRVQSAVSMGLLAYYVSNSPLRVDAFRYIRDVCLLRSL